MVVAAVVVAPLPTVDQRLWGANKSVVLTMVIGLASAATMVVRGRTQTMVCV
jgi:hypothetical protein